MNFFILSRSRSKFHCAHSSKFPTFPLDSSTLAWISRASHETENRLLLTARDLIVYSVIILAAKNNDKFICKKEINHIIKILRQWKRTVARTLCKVFPSPGIARSVWLLPQTASCNMVADTDHPATPATHDKDGNEADIAEQSNRTIFDLVKSG